MKILITSIVDLKRSAPGRLHWFIRHLSRKHDITVLSINDWWKASKTDTSLYTQGFQLGNISVHYLTRRRFSPILQEVTSATTARSLLRKMRYRDFDVHLNYNSLISGYSVARKLRPLGINTVYDIADDLPKMIGNSPQLPSPFRGIGRLFGRFMLRKNMKISGKVTYVTTNLRDLYHVSDDKAVVIPNGVDVQMFHPSFVQSLKRELGLEGSFVVGFVGTLREWVDLRPVFEAVKRLGQMGTPTKMLVVGDEGGMEMTRQIAGSYGILDKVKFTGTVPYVQVPEYTCCMDVCVMPLKFDNAQPLSFLQYLACGKPVISTRPLEVPPDVLLYAADGEGYTKRLVELSRSASLREELGSRGREYVEKYHDWRKIGERMEDLLVSVATQRGSVS